MNVHQNLFIIYDDNSLISFYLSIVHLNFVLYFFGSGFVAFIQKIKRKLFNYIKETNLIINMATKIGAVSYKLGYYLTRISLARQ